MDTVAQDMPEKQESLQTHLELSALSLYRYLFPVGKPWHELTSMQRSKLRNAIKIAAYSVNKANFAERA